ncbi:aminodeoxychorismate lyase [Vibrio japonicus]|uniref:Aminodeoxychorismate lyase n=1 Tax=Vibrio japonicus TaxID=1824638 RepID=A0ABY5LHA1_9VIBR|nr:aminodeoxychorismate lyase [Vibrio japonicus]UUM31424.1 aminodeoxychorismate lyase [Vibrio japonicus]
MYWLNGQLTDSVSLSDRSFHYGDGCFTTMLTVDGKIEHWHKHIERMESCLCALGIEIPDWQMIEMWLAKAIESKGKAGVKLHISRGEGGRGYSPTQVTSPNVTISAFQFPVHYDQWSREGIELGICQKKLGINPMLAGHKHNNRLEQVLLKADIEQQGFSDGIALDYDGNVVETTMANVFWCIDGNLYTPKLSKAGVAGVMRRVVLERASNLDLKVYEGEFKLGELLTAEEVFVTNSILGIAPVTAIGKQRYSIGQITRRIQENPVS